VNVTTRIVIVVDGGLVRDVYGETALDVDLRVVDFDAEEFGEQWDSVHEVDGRRAWITGHPVVVAPQFVSVVFAAWDQDAPI
jgi:hypothetical protein